MKLYLRYIISLWAILTMVGCGPKVKDAVTVEEMAPMYPDYAGTMVPVNIAPLNFLLRGDYDAMEVTARHGDNTLKADCNRNQASFPLKAWHKLLAFAASDSINIDILARKGDKWLRFPPVSIAVSPDSIDPYLTYRLIEPDYEIFSRLHINERCIENFEERSICDYQAVGNRCMNCHTYGHNDPDLSFLYVRGEGGGMILNQQGQLSKINLKEDDMVSGSVYAQFSPSGRYIAFSTNVIIPGFHSMPSKRLEVFDTKSDIYVADVQTGNILRSPLLCDSLQLETFPCFSPDGKYLYYCTAERLANSSQLDSLQYSICRLAFDETTGDFGEDADTIAAALPGLKQSACHPRISPDGHYLLYTVADYGTFPIWHRESDQCLMDLQTREIIDLDIVNSDMSDTYHSWSSTGRWWVFASKRDDGLYGKPYFVHISPDGEVSKPFVLPQKYPIFYDNCLLSFNAPELGTGPLPFKSDDVGKLIK